MRRDEKEKKVFLQRIAFPLILAGALIVMGVSIYKIVTISSRYSEGRETYGGLSDDYTQVQTAPVAEAVAPLVEQEIVSSVPLEPCPISVDFDSLINDVSLDICGWVYCPDTVINYPVLHCSNNEYYLNHNARGAESAVGAIFMEAANHTDFSDRSTALHGHHMNDGSMFASIEKWQKQEFFDEHPVMYLSTVASGNYKIEFFAAFVTRDGSDVYRLDFGGDAGYGSWLETIRASSKVQSDVEVSASDRVLVLSTCAYSSEDARSVLIGKMTQIG